MLPCLSSKSSNVMPLYFLQPNVLQLFLNALGNYELAPYLHVLAILEYETQQSQKCSLTESFCYIWQ